MQKLPAIKYHHGVIEIRFPNSPIQVPFSGMPLTQFYFRKCTFHTRFLQYHNGIANLKCKSTLLIIWISGTNKGYTLLVCLRLSK